MRRSLANVSGLTRVVASAIAAAACGGIVQGVRGGDGGTSESGVGADSSITDASAGDAAVVACDFSPGAIPDPLGDCGVAPVEVVDAVSPNVDPSAQPDIHCWNFNYQPSPECCGPQMVTRLACQYCFDEMMGNVTCALRVTDPCVTDVNEAADACAGWCGAVAARIESIYTSPYGCYLDPWDGSGPIVAACLPNSSGCGTGRPPRSFRPRVSRAPSPTAAALSLSAQLEAASVCAFRVLARDLERFGAPRSLVTSARRAARDETRHARAMRRAAKRRGCSPPRVQAKAAAATSLFELATRNAEEGCVRETLGAALALLQSRTACDPTLRQTMHRIARDELRHAAFSWRLQEWLLARLTLADADALAAVRRRALDELHEELARGPAADPPLGLPGPRALRALLQAMSAHVS